LTQKSTPSPLAINSAASSGPVGNLNSKDIGARVLSQWLIPQKD
jgi:hypothetical protein